MADNILKVRTELDNGPLDSGLQQAVASTKAATEEMSAAFEKHAEAVSNAVKSIGAAAKTMGADVSEPIVDLIALMPELASAIEAATSVSGVLALIGVLAQLAIAIKAWADGLGEVDAAEKKRHDKAINDAKDELQHQEKLIEGTYALQIANAKDPVEKQRLRVQMQTALVGLNEKYVASLQKETDRLKGLANEERTIGQEQIDRNNRSLDLIPSLTGRILAMLHRAKAEGYAKLAEANNRLVEEAQAALSQATANQKNAENALTNDIKNEADKRRAERRREADQRAAEQKRVFQIDLDAAIAHIQALDGIERQKLQFERQIGQLSDEEYEKRLKEQVNKTYHAVHDELEAKLTAAAKEPEEQARIKAEIEKLDDKYRADSDRLDEDAALRKKKRDDDEAAHHLQATRAQIEGEIESAREAEQTKEELLRRDFEQGKITKKREIEAVREAKLKELQQESEYYKQLRDLYKQGTKEWQDYQNRLEKIHQQGLRVRAKAEADEANSARAQLRKQMLEWQRLNIQFEHAFMNTLNSMNSNLASFVVEGKANWRELAASAIETFIQIALQYAESMLIMEILDALGLGKKKAKNAEEANSSANAGAANTLADVPYPENIPASFTVLSIGETFAARATAEGGQWEVPRIQPTILHPQEMVLPAGIASRMRDMVESGGTIGSRSALVFAPTVHALDAQGVDRVLTRHQRIFENRVDKVLKKKGFYAR